MFGAEDRFLNVVAETIHSWPFFPLVNNGNNLVQPVSVKDIAKAVMRIIYDWRDYEGKTFQFAGPSEYTYKEVIEFVSDVTTLKATMVNIPTPAAKTAAGLIEQLINPVITADQISQMLEDNIQLDNPELLTLNTLGIEPVSMDRLAFDYLHRFRPGGHFVKVEGYHNQLKL